MTLTALLVLFVAMVMLALIPGPGVMCVSARSVSAGLGHALFTTGGIVAGDFVFISFALFGLAALANTLGDVFVVIKYCAAAYLVFLGLQLLLRNSQPSEGAYSAAKPSYWGSFFAGLITTLGNPKAILFYFSFFPAFLDLQKITIGDALMIYLTAIVAIGGITFGYAYLAHRAKHVLASNSHKPFLRVVPGSMLMACGIYMACRD